MPKALDLIGQRFVRLLVIGAAPPVVRRNGKPIRMWACRCDCGVEVAVQAGNLRSGNSKSCGCLSREAASDRLHCDLTGRRFTRLVALSRVGTSKTGAVSWQCACDCGATTTVFAQDLTNEKTRSCGCLKRDRAALVRADREVDVLYGDLE